MSKISTYPSADNPLLLSDRLIGTEGIRPISSLSPFATKNFSLGELLQLFLSNFPAATLQAVLNAGNIATQDITLIGTIDATLIKTNNIEDTSGSQGLPFQYLSKGTSSINWVDLPVSTLQSILDENNTATQNIILIGNITSTLIIPGDIKDENNKLGTIGQVLSKSATGIRWINIPSSFTAGLSDVLAVGNFATNDIYLTGNIFSTLITPENIKDKNGSIGSEGQILTKKAIGFQWDDNFKWFDYIVGKISSTTTPISGGVVQEFSYAGTTEKRYRFIPSPYNPATDIIYTTFSGGVLSNPIAYRLITL